MKFSAKIIGTCANLWHRVGNKEHLRQFLCETAADASEFQGTCDTLPSKLPQMFHVKINFMKLKKRKRKTPLNVKFVVGNIILLLANAPSVLRLTLIVLVALLPLTF